jgi:hypothetical protein
LKQSFSKNWVEEDSFLGTSVFPEKKLLHVIFLLSCIPLPTPSICDNFYNSVLV